MDDDLSVSGALAAVHEAVTRGNTALDEGEPETARDLAALVIAMTDVLGVNPLDPAWSGADSTTSDALGALDVLVRERLAARVCRDSRTFDAIRDGSARRHHDRGHSDRRPWR